MAPEKSDSPEAITTAKPALSEANGTVPSPRSEALEAELAMLEAILPAEAERSAPATRVDPADNRGVAQ